MGENILSAILNIANFGIFDLKNYATKSRIRVNAVGDQLEFYIKDSISNSFNKKTEEEKEKEYQKTLSYDGNQNNPPDFIVKDSDAFEIKKIEKGQNLQLNSSYPKDILYSDDSRITSFCRSCESKPWKQKDIFYVVGNVQKKEIRSLFFVQGTCYCADREVYERISKPLKEDIKDLIKEKNLESTKTNELGKIIKTDPLGITDLRIRGMWHIQNPLKVFSEHCKIDNQNKFSLFTLLEKKKYNSYDKKDRDKLEKHNHILVKEIKIKNPNNPSKTIEAKLIILMIK